MKKILIVEDNEEYRKVADISLKNIGGIEPVYAIDYVSAIKILDEENFEGALIDIFLPYKTGSGDISVGLEAIEKMKEDELKRYPDNGEMFIPLYEAIQKSEYNQPLGILIAEIALEKKLPFVNVTSTYHHDELTEPINHYVHKRWKIVDCMDYGKNKKSQTEFWDGAYSILEENCIPGGRRLYREWYWPRYLERIKGEEE